MQTYLNPYSAPCNRNTIILVEDSNVDAVLLESKSQSQAGYTSANLHENVMSDDTRDGSATHNEHWSLFVVCSRRHDEDVEK